MSWKIWTPVILAGTVFVSAGCTSSGGGAGGGGAATGPGGTLPISASGKMLAVRLPGTAASSTNSYTKTPQVDTTVTGVTAVDRTATGGVGVSGSVVKDPNPNPNQGSAVTPAALITAKADSDMAGGAAIVGITDGKGNVYFENGNFGDPQVETATAAVSSVGVYNPQTGPQIVLKDATTIRYRDGIENDGFVNYGVGYVGNATQNMPGSGTATYAGFYEHGLGGFVRADGTIQSLYMQGNAELAANFATGKVSGGVTGSLGYYNSQSQTVVNPNADVTGIKIDANITGSEYAGSAAFIDAGGNEVGSYVNNEAIGGFFGSGAAETAAAVSMEGNMAIEGTNRDYIFQGVIGAIKK